MTLSKLFTVILFPIVISSCNYSSQKTDAQPLKADISFQSKTFEFGTVLEGKIVEAHYIFTNKSNVPLILYDVKPSCGCTIINWNSKPIKPNKSDTIKVRFDSRHKIGLQKKFISVFSNTKEYLTLLSLEGNVTINHKTI